MLTGDNKETANIIAQKISIQKVIADVIPSEKAEIITKLQNEGKKVMMCGDGINDSPVLAEADFGISMGEGTEIASNSADGILISNNIGMLPNIIKTAKKSICIVKFNIAFSLIIKAIVLALGILGIAPIWLAIVADTGVSLLTVINSVRIFK